MSECVCVCVGGGLTMTSERRDIPLGFSLTHPIELPTRNAGPFQANSYPERGGAEERTE